MQWAVRKVSRVIAGAARCVGREKNLKVEKLAVIQFAVDIKMM